jgi:hypothetical protein
MTKIQMLVRTAVIARDVQGSLESRWSGLPMVEEKSEFRE